MVHTQSKIQVEENQSAIIKVFMLVISFVTFAGLLQAQVPSNNETKPFQNSDIVSFLPGNDFADNASATQVGTIENHIRSLAFMPDSSISGDTTGELNFSSADSLFAQPKPQLLPDKISFMENFLWGENGFVRTIGIEPPLTPQVRENEIHIRRTMLIAHQIGGFTTLALMWAAAYFGQRVIDGKRSLGGFHQAFVGATIASYTATGLLAVLSPPPLIRTGEGGTTGIHKILAWVHLAGMIITPILGSSIRHKRVFNMDQAHFHQVAGYLTTAVFTASMLVITF